MILVLVTGQTERAAGYERCDPGRRVTGVAVLVGLNGRLVRRNDLTGGVTAGARAVYLVMLVVAGDTLHDGRIRLKRHALPVAVHARQRAMFVMLKPDGPRPRGMRQHRDGDLHRSRRGEL